jgi:hypothetical protein
MLKIPRIGVRPRKNQNLVQFTRGKWVTQDVVPSQSSLGLLLFGLSSLLLSCSPVQFQDISGLSDSQLLVSQPRHELVMEKSFSPLKPEAIFQQEDLERNVTTVQFQVLDPQGRVITDFDPKSDLELREDGQLISDFDAKSESQVNQQVADIIFAVDVTGSMTPTIESAKRSLINFIRDTRGKGYKTRMCTMTFGDYTVKHCQRFYLNDPAKPESEIEVELLIKEIQELKALKGIGLDPGGSDLNENPMRALIDAAKSPWGQGHSRFVILVTDDGFLYSPGNEGSVGSLAPRMSEVHQAIEQSGMKVFAVTPDLPGYNRPFRVRENNRWVTYDSIVTKSQGEFFLFSDWVSGRINLDTVLNRILRNILTTYHVSFVVDDYEELKPNLPLSQRRIQLKSRKSGYEIRVGSIQSNLPEGRKEYQREWVLSDHEIDPERLEVWLNGQKVQQGFKLLWNRLVWDRPPRSKSEIRVRYQHKELARDMVLEEWELPVPLRANELVLELNGERCDERCASVRYSGEGRVLVSLYPHVLHEEQYKLSTNRELRLRVYRLIMDSP